MKNKFKERAFWKNVILACLFAVLIAAVYFLTWIIFNNIIIKFLKSLPRDAFVTDYQDFLLTGFLIMVYVGVIFTFVLTSLFKYNTLDQRIADMGIIEKIMIRSQIDEQLNGMDGVKEVENRIAAQIMAIRESDKGSKK